MNATYKFNPETRKALVKALAEILETKPTYLGMPSAAYQIGEYHLAKDGTLTGPDSAELLKSLLAAGIAPESLEADLTEETPEEPAEQPKVAVYARFSTEAKALGLAEDPGEPDKSSLPRLYTLITPRGEIFITEEFATHDEAAAEGYGEAFSTALGTVYSYGDNRTFALVTAHKAGDWDTTTIGQDFRVAAPAEEAAPEFPTSPELDRVVIEYPLTGFTPQALDNLCKMVVAKEELIKLAIGAQELPIQVLEDRIAFPWLQTADPELVDALATFICALCKTALTKKRVTATPQPTGINDRYRFRCFMLHIGMIGPEYATARTRLLRDLSGNSGWLNGPPEKAPEAENVVDTADLVAAAAEVIEAAGGEVISITAAEEPEEAEAHD
jgi:hypothetical protein